VVLHQCIIEKKRCEDDTQGNNTDMITYLFEFIDDFQDLRIPHTKFYHRLLNFFGFKPATSTEVSSENTNILKDFDESTLWGPTKYNKNLHPLMLMVCT